MLASFVSDVRMTHSPDGMQEALWRTNHGYDPTWLSTVVGSEKPGGDSFLRYMLIHDTVVQYANTNTLIGDAEALNITAVREFCDEWLGCRFQQLVWDCC